MRLPAGEDGPDEDGRIRQQYRQKGPRVAYVFDEEKNSPRKVHEQSEEDQRENSVNEPPLVKARIGHRAPVQKNLIQKHVQEDAEVAQRLGARAAQERGLGSVLRRREVAEDQNRLEDVVDESDPEDHAAARPT